MKNKQIIVVGLGRFGNALAETLVENGCEVMAIDTNEERLDEIAPRITHTVCADATDAEALDALGVRNFDVAVVTIGTDIKASTVATMLLKEKGVGRVIAKAHDELHARLLLKVGADKIVFPERDMGRRMAHLEFIRLSPDYTLSEIQPPANWVGKSLLELNLRTRYKINVIAIRANGKINPVPHAEDVIREGDALFVLGPTAGIQELERKA